MTKHYPIIAMLCFVFQVCVVVPASADQPPTGPVAPTGPVDAASAEIVAKHHLTRNDVADRFHVSSMRTLRADQSSPPLCYFFDLSPAGYVVVSADAVLPPVIAYSFTSPSPCDLSFGTPLVDLLTWDIEQRLAHSDLLPEAVVGEIRAAWLAALDPAVPAADGRLEQWPPAGSTPTGGWILTNWTQSAPYNNMCPMDLSAGARSIAGCPAVAMAQIINYNARLNGVYFDDDDDYYHNYGGNRYWIDDDYIARGFPSFPQLNAYLDALFDDYFNDKALDNTDKAALVFACGVAARQVYTASAAGTFGVDQALEAYQEFNCDTAVLLGDEDSSIYEHLAQNMMDARPAHLAVVNPEWTVGHNVVVDGYNTDDYFHINFGWGGAYNGWYVIPSGLPYSLTVLEGVIVDIMINPCDPQDCDCDGLVDWGDFEYFEDCFAGPADAFSAPGCSAFDADADTDVDLRDFSGFQAAFAD